MKRLIPLVFVLAISVSIVEQASAHRRVVVHQAPHRTTVVVHRGWPLSRPARVVVVRPATVAVRVQPRVYLRPVTWVPTTVAVAVSAPTADALTWVDGATLDKTEDWTELTFNCGHSGSQLWYEVKSGKVQADWAEVVFANGETQVVDFAERTQDP